MPAPLVPIAVLIARAVALAAAKQGVKQVSKSQAKRIAAQVIAKRNKSTSSTPKDRSEKSTGEGYGPENIYRAPARNNRPRLRDTDDMPRKTTVRQQIGPKTKSGKFSEKKYKPKTNTKPPARTPKEEKPKAETPAVTKVGGRVIAINKRSNNPRIRKRQEAQLRIARREFLTERKRQEKLQLLRDIKNKSKEPGPVTRKVTGNKVEGQKTKVREQKFPRSSAKSEAESRPSQATIESRIAEGAEKLDVTSRNVSKTPQYTIPELRRYAQQLRDSQAKSPNVSPEQIARGRARATMPTAERRAREIAAVNRRAGAAAKRRGLTKAQVESIERYAKNKAARIRNSKEAGGKG
jgi:hypothetical protein